MSAETADNAGTPQSKQFLMVNIDMFRHPKYYKELRRAGVQVNSSRPAHSRCNKSDQVISDEASTEATSVHPGPGQSTKPQAPSVKLSNQPVQASSHKPQALRHKPQASSHKQQALRSVYHGTRILKKYSWVKDQGSLP